ncbi:MAG: DUF5103 domain-containing protein [Bacteroidales bacterium]|nr:DUF5103 domain-containing protein [Bacteroidales bacterium]
MRYNFFLNVIIITLISLSCFGFDKINIEDRFFYGDDVKKENIKTILFHRQGWELSLPVIQLNTDEKLRLAFDDLDADIKNYAYTIIHCNSEWKPSPVSTFDYLDGFEEGYIKVHDNSFNTTRFYTHYELEFPNEEMKPVISGNYVLIVYLDYDKENIVFTRRFYVVDTKVKIESVIKQPKVYEFSDTGQEIKFSIQHEGLAIRDPFSEIKTIILQNGDWNNSILVKEPQFVRPGQLDYYFDNKIVFMGINEFRYVDFKSVRYINERLVAIEYMKPYYHGILKNDEDKLFKPYFFQHDQNGQFYIDVQEGVNKNVEADYVYVHFSLPFTDPAPEDEVYVYGKLTDWQMKEENKMNYNSEKQTYELSLLLKQGYYNYHYVLYNKKIKQYDFVNFEGSHFETENDYYILVYYKENISNYERLIGIERINTLKD